MPEAPENGLETRIAVGKPQLSVVIPCYNEADVLTETYRRVTDICRQTCGDAYELLLVDDGSRDGTWPLIERLAHDNARVVGVRLSRNHGHQLALTAGLNVSAGERVLVIDADLQDPPELLPRMMEIMDKTGADVVYGQRLQRHGESRFKKITASLFYSLLTRLADTEIPTDSGDFRLMSCRLVRLLNEMPEYYRFVRGMVSWLGFKQIPLLYERDARFAGTTKYPLRKMVRFALDGITSFSIIPLRIASLLGFLFGIVGLCGLVYALTNWLAGNTVPGWTSVILTVLILGSIQLFVVGIFGEYLGRLYIESKHRPLFMIERVIGRSGGDLINAEGKKTDISISK